MSAVELDQEFYLNYQLKFIPQFIKANPRDCIGPFRDPSTLVVKPRQHEISLSLIQITTSRPFSLEPRYRLYNPDEKAQEISPTPARG